MIVNVVWLEYPIVRRQFDRLSLALNIQCRENVRDLDTHLPDCNLFGKRDASSVQIILTEAPYAKIEPRLFLNLKKNLRNITSVILLKLEFLFGTEISEY